MRFSKEVVEGKSNFGKRPVFCSYGKKSLFSMNETAVYPTKITKFPFISTGTSPWLMVPTKFHSFLSTSVLLTFAHLKTIDKSLKTNLITKYHTKHTHMFFVSIKWLFFLFRSTRYTVYFTDLLDSVDQNIIISRENFHFYVGQMNKNTRFTYSQTIPPILNNNNHYNFSRTNEQFY